ncbi:DUF4304 domain-containing protein [Agromyces sp. NPDC004153]
MNIETAQQAFVALVNTGLSPGFRARGWTGSGGKYQLPSESHWVLAGVQKSSFSDRDEVRFTVNLTVVSRADWTEIRERRGGREAPNATTHPGSPGHWERLGMLASPDNVDVWWSVSPQSDLAEVAKSVMSTLDEYGTPWLSERL